LINENIYDLSIRISTKETISQLKSRIAEILNIDVDDFIMKKYGPNGTEIKNLKSILRNLSPSDINLFLELGTPLKEDEILLNMNYCEVDMSEFKIYPYKFIPMDKFIIHIKDRVKDIKRRLVIYIKEKLNIEIENQEYLIIRECKQDKPSKVN